MECYALSHRLDPRAIPPLVNASIAYNILGENDKAEESLRQALQLEPTNPAVNLNLGMLMGELGRLQEAEQAFRAALKADPQSAAAAYNLGVVLVVLYFRFPSLASGVTDGFGRPRIALCCFERFVITHRTFLLAVISHSASMRRAARD